MGSAIKFVLLLFSASLLLLLLNFEAMEGAALRLATHQREDSVVVAVAGDVGSRFRMLIGLSHHRLRHQKRHKRSAAPAPAPAQAPIPAPAPALVHEVRSPAPTPLPPLSHGRMPHRIHNHIAPVRSMARKLGGGGQPRLPKGAIVTLAVIGACLLVVGLVIIIVCLRRSRGLKKGDLRPSKIFFHGSRAQRFDEQMIVSLFAYNFQGPVKNEDVKSKTLSTSKHVIEHHKLQNTTILLKTLNASTEQVCNSITEGTGLSVQQLEALVKMKPTKEEEEKLLAYDGDTNMLEPAENFVKALLTIPMAFSRIEAMLYKETFDDEVAHLRTSFSVINVSGTILSNL
ncbi:hypothetical protein PR202_ga21048 [Eleusine coracana subsp. coracana]|uniref:FH2 domain-containing protein n=1 Tax=Eleusine coracana subsp. coracana TaxID=191504 RepID=A0AAV5D011_ELECO|nr:hypothetical protein PR202_ga21048 [Eleusine coracana subsp. coracana]